MQACQAWGVKSDYNLSTECILWDLGVFSAKSSIQIENLYGS